MRSRSVTTRASRARRFALTVLVIGAAVLLAACGSSSSSSSKAKPTTTTKPTSSTAATTGAIVVKTVTNPTLGTILVDADGKTLYTLTNAGAAVPCTGQCLTVWPPLLLPAGTMTATGGDGVTGLATTAAGGGTQVTQAGLPLYHFAADMAAGDAKGEGLSSFGGTWHVVKVAGSGSSGGAGSTGSTASTTTTTNSSGY